MKQLKHIRQGTGEIYEVEFYDADGSRRGQTLPKTLNEAIKYANEIQGKHKDNNPQLYYVEQVRVYDKSSGVVKYIKDDVLYPTGKKYAKN